MNYVPDGSIVCDARTDLDYILLFVKPLGRCVVEGCDGHHLRGGPARGPVDLVYLCDGLFEIDSCHRVLCDQRCRPPTSPVVAPGGDAVALSAHGTAVRLELPGCVNRELANAPCAI